MSVVIQVEMRDTSLVYRTNAEGEPVNPRPKNSKWWQDVRFENESDPGVAGTKALRYCQDRWPNATTYEIRQLKKSKGAVRYEEL